MKIIQDDYTVLRQEQATKTLPVTPRQLETMIRLSTAHAKIRLSRTVERQDCEAAREIMRFALYNDTQEAENRRKTKQENHRKLVGAEDTEEESEEDSEEDSEDEEPVLKKRRTSVEEAQGGEESSSDEEVELDEGGCLWVLVGLLLYLSMS